MSISRRSFLKCSAFYLPAIAVAARCGSAFAETLNGTVITSLPAVISTSGLYILQQDFSLPVSSGAAIVVAADNVTIDMNGHFITNTAAAPNRSIAILAKDRDNVTVRNGKVANFFSGVFINSTNNETGGHIVENMEIVLPYGIGIQLSGKGVVAKRNRILGAGGPSFSGCAGVIGIGMRDAVGVNVHANQVALNPLIQTTPTIGIIAGGTTTNALVTNNLLQNAGLGIVIASTAASGYEGKYHGNSAIGVGTPFLGGENGSLNASA